MIFFSTGNSLWLTRLWTASDLHRQINIHWRQLSRNLTTLAQCVEI